MKTASIVLAPFNNNEAFKKVFLQVLTKTNFNFNELELIIIDNNINEENILDIKKFLELYTTDYPIKYYNNRNNYQLAGATNKAIELSDSKWFVYLCSNDTYIYHNDWLKSMTEGLSDDDYTKGFRIGGTIAHWPNFLPNPKDHVHVQGGIFIAFTEYMKNNKYSTKFPFSFMDTNHSAHCIKQGFKLKHIASVFSSMATVNDRIHQENKTSNKYYVTHLHGNYLIK